MASRPPAIFLLLVLPLLCYVVSIEAGALPDDIPESIWLSDEVVPESSFVTTDAGSSNCIKDTGGTCHSLHCDSSRQASCDSDHHCVCNPDQCAVAGKCVVNPSASSAEKAKSTDTGGTCGNFGSTCDSSRGAKCVGNKCICKQGHAVGGKCVEEDGQTPGGIQFNEDLYTCWAQTPTEEEARNKEAINTDTLCFTGSPERRPQGSSGQFSPTHGFPHEYKGTFYDTSTSCRAACTACQDGDCFQSNVFGGDRQYYQSCSTSNGCGHGLSCDSSAKCVPYKTEGEACESSGGGVKCGHDLWCSDKKMKALNTLKGTSDKQMQHRCTKSFWKSSFLSTINWGDVADAVMVVGFVVSVVATGGAALVVDAAVDGAVDVAADGVGDATADAAEDEGAEMTSDEVKDVPFSKTVKFFKLADKIGHTLNKLCDYGQKLEAAYDCIECIRSNCTGIEGEVTATYKALDTFKTSLENSDSTKFTLNKQLVLAAPAVIKLIKTPKLKSDVQHIHTCIKCWKPCKKLK